MPRKDFVYFEPTYDQMVSTVDKQSPSGLFKPGIKLFKAAEGARLVRILPATWKGAKHYGFPVMIHNNVGPDSRRFLCNVENEGSPYENDPVCDERYKLGRDAPREQVFQFRPYTQIAYYIVDRDHESEGPQLWLVSREKDSEIAALCVNRRKGSLLRITNPYEGYDLEFTRKGTGRATKYLGFQISREPSPLADRESVMDDWLEYISANPIPDVRNFCPPETMARVFFGRPVGAEESADSRRALRDEAAAPEEPRLQRRAALPPEPEPEPGVEERSEVLPPARRVPRYEETDDEGPAPGRARRLAEDLDDEIPERPTRSAEREEPGLRLADRADVRPRQPAPADDADEEPLPPRRRRVLTEEEDEPTVEHRPARAGRGDGAAETPAPARNDDRRERLRARLNREE